MANIACGSCAECRRQIVYVAFRDGRRKVIVACHDCQVEMQFDLENLVAASEPGQTFEEILENFHPKGKPS